MGYDITWINDNLAISGAIDSYEKLSELGIDIVVNIRAEQHDDIPTLTTRGISYYWIPVSDYFEARTFQIQSFVNIIKKNPNRKILVHCALGIGRSAMLICAYLIETKSMSVDESVEYLTDLRPIVRLSPPQINKLRIYYENYYK